jgi:hypothetical protein
MDDHPHGSIGGNSQKLLRLQGRDTILLINHQINRPESLLQWGTGFMKNGIDRYRTLIPTGLALIEGPLGMKIESFMTTAWILISTQSAPFDQILPTFLIRGKHLLKPRKINGLIHFNTL